MTQPLSIAVVGLWHVHAGDYARETREHPDTRLSAVWDPDADLARSTAEEWGVQAMTDLDELLAREDIDAITVTTSTVAHVDIISRAIRAGKHVFTEKLLAPTVDECERLVREADERGVALVVSLPRLSEPTTLAVLRELRAGNLGTLTYSRVRLAHNGWVADWLPERFGDPAEAIGGALTDLGCHPAYLTRLFHGATPASVTASYGRLTGRAVEDQASVAADFGDGRLGLIEASNVTTPGAYTLELRGTDATILFGFGGERMLAKGGSYGPDEWVELALPDAQPSPFQQWVTGIRTGVRADDNLEAAIELTRVVEASNRSAAEGRTVPVSAG
jgi:1,5-anhydro-D-fructose reductase (1,5-anhydro-D-mannitol-forming)